MTKIEWTDRTWNPTAGCTEQSAGCTNCYAKHMAHRLAGIATSKAKYEGLTTRTTGGAIQWTGKISFDEKALLQPYTWKKPCRIFVDSMGDLFHPEVPYSWILKVWKVMYQNPQHTFQILTKFPRRMSRVVEEIYYNCPYTEEVLPNVWLGTSVEDASQESRIRDLLAAPAALHFLSCEPLIGPLGKLPLGADGIGWVIAGGESLTTARPMHPDWVRSLRDQCEAAGVPFFFKQWGEWGPDDLLPVGEAIYEHYSFGKNALLMGLEHMYKLGKSRTGHLLDGQTYQQFPDETKGWRSTPPSQSVDEADDSTDDEPEFDHCGDCIQEDACSDFGCAVKAGLQEPSQF